MPAVMPLLVQQRLFWQWVPERLLLCRSMRYYAEKREPHGKITRQRRKGF